MNFKDRNELHNNAQEKLIPILEKYGIEVRKYGIESNKLNGNFTQKLWVCKNDVNAVFARFQADKIAITPKNKVYFIEVKSTNKSTNNYSCELDSYEMGLMKVKLGLKIFIVFDCEKANWMEKINPNCIHIPSRNTTEYFEKIKERYPHIPCFYLKKYRGSGTPYILISKDDSSLIDFHDFIKNELLGGEN